MKSILLKVEESTIVSVTEDAQYVLDLTSAQKTGTEHIVQLNFETPGVTGEIIGLYKLENGGSLHLTTIANHVVPNTSCDTKIKGVLNDHCKSSYLGKIIIDKKAQQTSSFLHDSVLVLGENTINRSDPVLEIEANDVQASHGATTGRVDDMQVYYLRSRGLTTEEAINLVVSGYYQSLLAEIKDDKVREAVSTLIK